MARALIGKPVRAQMLLGGCAAGKTVLLVQIEAMARRARHLSSRIDACAGRSLNEQLVPAIRKVLRHLARVEPAQAQAQAHHALGALSAFASAARMASAPGGLDIEPPVVVADSGHLDSDLADLLACVGQAAQAGASAWTLLIDDFRCLRSPDLKALLTSLHLLRRERLPVLFIDAGVPQVAALAGNAQPYAERLLRFHNLEPLRPEDARAALRQPIEDAGARIGEDALADIVRQTASHPYFVQEWGHQCREVAQGAQITARDALPSRRPSDPAAGRRLLQDAMGSSHPERARVRHSPGPAGPRACGAFRIAAPLGEAPQRLGQRRARLISKGPVPPGAGGCRLRGAAVQRVSDAPLGQRA